MGIVDARWSGMWGGRGGVGVREPRPQAEALPLISVVRYDAVSESGRPARIEVRTAQLHGMVEVSFRDNGTGIAHAERIFDPFFTTKEVGKGTGLGLSICYGIIREHGGEISCYNNEDGVGATFVIRLPAAAEALPIASSAGALPA